MPSTYSTNLALELIGTGDQAGVWGNTTNTNLGTLIEQAISGYVTQAVATGTDTTITIPNGATGVARNMYIELTGTGGTNTNLIVPSNKKLYFIFNNSTGAVTVKVSGQTGVSVPQGKKMVLVSNGTDIVNGLNYIADFGTNSFTVTNLTATSATITTLTGTSAGITTISSGSANITQLQSTSATITTLTGTSANITTLSGTTATFTSATVTNLALTSVTLSNLNIASANITTLTSSSATISTTLALSGGTANGVLYLNASKVATSGSALTFDGTNLGVNSPILAARTLSVKGRAAFTATANDSQLAIFSDGSTNGLYSTYNTTGSYLPMTFWINDAEQMRLTSTGLGIGTSSPGTKLDVAGDISLSNEVYLDNGKYIRFKRSSGGLSIQTLGIESGTDDVRLLTTGSLKVVNGSLSTLMLLDSSGNLGLGVTPSAWSLGKALQIGTSGAAALLGYNNNFYLTANAYYDGSWKYTATAAAGRYQVESGVHSWSYAASGTAGNTITFTQAMTLDASGNLLVGSTTNTSGLKLLASDGTVSTGFLPYGGGSIAYTGTWTNHAFGFATNGTERARITSGGDFLVGLTTGAKFSVSYGGNDTHFGLGANYDNYITAGSSGVTIFRNTSTERARITAVGNVGIGTTSPAYPLDVAGAVQSVGYYINGNTSGGFVWVRDNYALRFGTNDTERARITSGGDFLVGAASALASEGFTIVRSTGGNPVGAIRNGSATAGQYWIFGPNSSNNYILYNDDGNGVYILDGGTSWTSSSDERKKDIIEPIADAANKVASLRAVIGKYKTDAEGVRRSFLIAQDVKAVFPEAVDARNEDELGLSYTDTIPLLVAAIKEQQAMINELKAKVAALESK